MYGDDGQAAVSGVLNRMLRTGIQADRALDGKPLLHGLEELAHPLVDLGLCIERESVGITVRSLVRALVLSISGGA